MAKFCFSFTLLEQGIRKEYIVNASDQLSLERQLSNILKTIKEKYPSATIGQASLVQCEGAPVLIRQINIGDIL